MKSVARRVRPPKGKVERDKERHGYEKLKLFWARLNGDYVPNKSAKGRTDGNAASADVPGTDVVDPSDRIVVNREEFRRITGTGEENPRDPFEPRS